MGFDEEDICDCIVDFLNETHFYKAMPSERFPGLWQDVYKINYLNQYQGGMCISGVLKTT